MGLSPAMQPLWDQAWQEVMGDDESQVPNVEQTQDMIQRFQRKLLDFSNPTRYKLQYSDLCLRPQGETFFALEGVRQITGATVAELKTKMGYLIDAMATKTRPLEENDSAQGTIHPENGTDFGH